MALELAHLAQKLDEALVLLRALTEKPKPHLSQVEFAELTNRHPNTVGRWIRSGRIRTEQGRIPRSELTKFTS